MTLRRLPVTLAALLGACLGSGTAATLALASFTSSAPASQTLSSRSLTAPGSLTATPTGHDVALSWTSGANGTGYSVLAAANGTNSNCSSVTYTSLTTTTGLTYADTSRYQPQGTYECYQSTNHVQHLDESNLKPHSGRADRIRRPKRHRHQRWRCGETRYR